MQRGKQFTASPLATHNSHLYFSGWGWSFEEKGLDLWRKLLNFGLVK